MQNIRGGMLSSSGLIMRVIYAGALFLLGYIGYIFFPYSINDQSMPIQAQQTADKDASSSVRFASVQEEPAFTQSSSGSVSSENLEQILSDALQNEDVKKRVAAIEALALAPKSRALPVLEKALTLGSIEEKRASLRSISEIAVRQNDTDSSIRGFLSQVGYHYDLQEISSDIQTALNYIEKNIN